MCPTRPYNTKLVFKGFLSTHKQCNLMYYKYTFMLTQVQLKNTWVNIFPLDEVFPLFTYKYMNLCVQFLVGSCNTVNGNIWHEEESNILMVQQNLSNSKMLYQLQGQWGTIFPQISHFSTCVPKNVNHSLNSNQL